MRPCCLLWALALVACKAESDQATRALPAPEPPATTKAELTPLVAAPDQRKDRPTRAIREDVEPARPTDSEPAAPAAPAPATAAAPATSAAPAADASCQQSCQASLQTCLGQQPPDPDGGTSMDGLAACKKALDDCRARCSP